MKKLFILEDYNKKTKKAVIMEIDTDTFYEEGWWKKVFPEVQEGNFVYSFKYELEHEYYGQFTYYIDNILCIEGGLSRDGISYYLILDKDKKITKDEIKKVKSHLKYMYDITNFIEIKVDIENRLEGVAE